MLFRSVESFDDAGTYDITFRVDANPTGVYFKDYDNGTAQDYTSWMTMGPNVNSNPSPQFLRSVGITGSLGVTGGITGSLQGTSSYATQALSASYAPSNPLPSGLVSGSSQIIYSGLTGIPSGIISGSAQLPSGIVSGSAQISALGFISSSVTSSMSVATASYVLNAVSASYATTASYVAGAGAAFPYTGSAVITGSLALTGSAVGNVNALSISSQTASLNLNDGNFFTLQLVSGSVTRIEPSNIKAGQTVNILLSTTGSGTVTFSTSVKQISGSSYIPTTTTSKDIITLVSFDATSLYLVAAKNLA